MAVTGTKLVDDRVKSSEIVQQTILTHGPRASSLLQVRFQPVADLGGSVTDFQELFETKRLGLKHFTDEMVGAINAHRQEVGEDSVARQRRDDGAAGVVDAIDYSRDCVQLFHGTLGAQVLGITYPLPRDPAHLLQFGQRLYQVVVSPSLQMPSSVVRNGKVADLPELAQILGDANTELEQALKDLRREAKETETSLLLKDEKVEVYDHVFYWAAQSSERLFRIAGMHKEADRVRPSRRRPGQTVQEAEANRQDAEADANAGNTSSPSVPSQGVPPGTF